MLLQSITCNTRKGKSQQPLLSTNMTDKPRKPLSLKPKATIPATTDKPSGAVTRSRKRVIKRDQLPAGKLATTKAPPKPKPKKKPRPAPKVPTTPPSDIRAELLNASLNGFDVWIKYYPLAIGIEKQIFQHIAKHSLSSSKRVVQKLLHQHTRDKRYLANLAAGGIRYNLDATEAQPIAQAEIDHAKRSR